MIKRILFVIFWAIWLPVFLVFVAIYPFWGMIVIGIYIVNGDKNDTLFDLATYPIEWISLLPFRIFGK